MYFENHKLHFELVYKKTERNVTDILNFFKKTMQTRYVVHVTNLLYNENNYMKDFLKHNLYKFIF